MTTKYIDPPSGWAYGFPKEFPEGVEDVNKWLVDNGYPQEQIDRWGESGMPVRFFYKEEDWE